MSSSDPYAQYQFIVGSYVTAFAELEHTISRLCLDYSGLSRPAYRVFMAKRSQLGDKIDILKKLIALARLDDEARSAVKDAFNQLSHLIALRHRMVHHGGYVIDTGQILIRMKEYDFSKDTGKSYDLYGKQELKDAGIDLLLVRNILTYRLDNDVTPSFPPAGIRAEPFCCA